MDLIVTIGATWLDTFRWLFWLGVFFAILVRFMPCNRGMYWWKSLRATGTDFCYWFITPLIVRVVRTVVVAGGIALLFGANPPGFSALRELELWQQCLAILLLQDVMLYWIRGAFHTPTGWKFHSIHHSPTVLDWMSAGRNHFVNGLLSFILADVVVQLIGFAPTAVFILAPFNILYSSMVHANLNWTFGPLRFVFASPVFHRWHHTLEGEGLNKNFASTFPILDLLFGTFHMPPGRLPQQFGNGEHEFPEGFLGQFIHPFRKKSAPVPRVPEAAELPPRRRAA